MLLKMDVNATICDIAIFVILKMAAAAILDFQNSKFLRTIPGRGPILVNVPNFIKIGHMVEEIW